MGTQFDSGTAPVPSPSLGALRTDSSTEPAGQSLSCMHWCLGGYGVPGALTPDFEGSISLRNLMLGGTVENGQQIGRGNRGGKGLGRNASVFLVCIFHERYVGRVRNQRVGAQTSSYAAVHTHSSDRFLTLHAAIQRSIGYTRGGGQGG